MKTKILSAMFVAAALTAPARAQSVAKGVEEGVVTLERIVEFGDKTLTLFGKYKPQVGVEPGSMGAVPEGLTEWSQLTGWKAPRITEERFHVKNAYGVVVADVGYKIIQEYGAGYEGKGKYLKATFIPSDVKVLWGWNLELTARVDAVSNLGTREDPVAGMVVTVQGRVHSLAAEFQTSGTRILRADGSTQVVSRPKNLDRTEEAVEGARRLAKQAAPVLERLNEDFQRYVSGR